MHLTKNMTKGCIVSIMVVMGLVFCTHCIPVHADENLDIENTVYVSVSGKSEGADGSLNNPFASIEDARDYLRTKDLVSFGVIFPFFYFIYSFKKIFFTI